LELLLAELTVRQQQGISKIDLLPFRDQITALTPLRGQVVSQNTAVSPSKIDTLWQQLSDLTPPTDWPYDEPNSLAEIQETLGAKRITAVSQNINLQDRIHGGLLGRFAGCMLGKPLEIPWSAATIRHYLELADAYPLRDYVPLLEPFPAEFPRSPWGRWQETTRDNITQVVQDDDVEYTLAAYLILKQHGFGFTTADVGQFWLNKFAYERLFTAERIAYRNMINGIDGLEVAAYRNPYREWIGAQIRADVYGYVCPGDPRRAAALAWKDAALSHTRNGIYGAMWVAAMVAAAFVLPDPETIILAGLAEIPPRSRLAEAVRDVVAWSKQLATWEEVFAKIDGVYGRFYQVDDGLNWVHTIPNACLVALGLMKGGGALGGSVGTAVMSGWDTDCNGATVGSIIGVMQGAKQLPDHWTAPLNDQIESHIPSCNGMSIAQLSHEITALSTFSQ
jgi:ADP-ribosylglycohydrolase